MKALSVLSSVCLIMVMTSCSPIMVKTDYDDEVDFSKYTSYDWTDVDEESSKSLMAKRLKAAVERELAEKGYVEATEEPDFLISYRVEVRDKVDVASYCYGCWPIPAGHWQIGYRPYGFRRYGHRSYGYWPIGYWDRMVDVIEYEEEKVILDFLDSDTEQVIWRGWGTIESRDPEKAKEKINEVVAKMLEKFPPNKSN